VEFPTHTEVPALIQERGAHATFGIDLHMTARKPDPHQRPSQTRQGATTRFYRSAGCCIAKAMSNEGNATIWSPLLWPFRAAVVLFGHVALGGVLVTCIWATARYVHWLYDNKMPKLYDKIPLEWVFDTMDVGVFGLFLVWGLIEANRELKRR
jgi:hypothetical protein